MVSNKVVTSGGNAPTEAELIQGVVASVHCEGEDGFVSASLRTAVAGVPEGTHITFSLKDWQGSSPPRKGQVVSLEDVSLFEKGWRALSARPIQMKTAGTHRGEQR